MSWEDIIARKIAITPNGKLSTTALVEILLQKGIIPPHIKDNATLHGILLTRILLKTLDAIEVPPAPQNREEIGNGIYLCRFSYRQNAKEMLKWSMGSKNQKELVWNSTTN